MDDNAPCHCTQSVQDCLENENIYRIDLPAHFSDLNIIQHMWDALERDISARQFLPTNKKILIHLVMEEWGNLPR